VTGPSPHRLQPPSPFVAALALCILTALAYSNSFGAGFALDNKGLILDDARVHEASMANVDLIVQHTYWWPRGESGLYRPFTTLSYLVNYAIIGNRDRPAGYHAVNLLLHLVNVLLVYALAQRLTRDGWASIAIAAVWSVHPLSTEAVTNIVGRADLLAALAVLGGLLMYLECVEATGVMRTAWLTGLAAITAVGVFSKENAVVILAVILLYEVTWRIGRPTKRWLPLGAVIAPIVFFLLERSAVLNATLNAEFPFTDNPIAGAGFGIGRLTAVTVMARYLWLIVWPARLSCDYSYAQIPLASGSLRDWLSVLVVAVFAMTVFSMFRRDRRAFFFGSFALATFLPASNLLFASGTIMAERLMYLPSVGLVALGVLGLFAVAARSGRREIGLVVIGAVVAGLGMRTWTRNADWKNDVVLWTAAVDASPRSAKAHRALAEALYDADPTHAHLDREIAEAERSLELLRPLPNALQSPQAYRQVAGYYVERGNMHRLPAADGGLEPAPEASRDYRRALAVAQESLPVIDAGSALVPGASTAPAADAHRLLAGAYLGLRDPRRALEEVTRARALEPSNALAYRQAAAALINLDRPDAAAVALMAGFMITNDAGVRQEVLDLYRAGLDQEGCAISATPNGPAFNPSCAIVHRHLCAGAAEAVQALEQMGLRGRAESLRRTVGDLRCDR
jgi:tetratricopeptide (TPR) repeat protein